MNSFISIVFSLKSEYSEKIDELKYLYTYDSTESNVTYTNISDNTLIFEEEPENPNGGHNSELITLSVNLDGGSIETDYSGNYAIGHTIELEAIPTKEGYAFTNWTCSDPLALSGNILTIGNEDLTLTANYREAVYTVKRSLTTESTAWERIDDNVGKVANATKNGSAVTNDFDNIYPWSNIITYNYNTSTNQITAYYGDDNFKFDGTNGEVLTRIPEFYYKREQKDGYEYVSISKYALTGYARSPEFSVGRYASSYDGAKLHSKSNTSPEASRTITDFRTLSQAVGLNFGQMDYHYFLIQLLYLVEYADYNSQAKIGMGIVNNPSGPSAQNQGGCDSLGMKSGTLNDDEKHCIIYRGMENIYGNIWQLVDGINVKDNVAYINYNPSTYSVDTFSGNYTQIGYSNFNSTSYPKTIGYDSNNPLISFPTSSEGSDSTYLADYYITESSGNRVVVVGGCWMRWSSSAGFWFWNTCEASTLSNIYVGSRLLKY